MSNLAINDWGTDRAWEEQVALMEFVEDIFSPKPKASILKFERSKHPVGRGEQATGNRYYDNWWWDAKISRKAAQAPSIEEGLAEYEETRSLKGYTEAKPAYADCAKEYRLMQEAQDQTSQWQKMERYERFLLNHGYVHFSDSDSDHVSIPAHLMPFDPNDLSQPWLVFLELEEREERQDAWFDDDWNYDDVLGDDHWEAMEYDNFHETRDFMEENVPAHAYVAPHPIDKGVRSWYAGKGKAARLTQRQYTADFGQPVPDSYNAYEGYNLED